MPFRYRLPGISLAVQCLGLHDFTAMDLGLIPGCRTKIPKAAKKKRQDAGPMLQIPSPGAFWFEHTVLHKLLFLFVVKHLVCWAAGRMWDWEDSLDRDDRQDTCPVTLQPQPAPLLEGARPVGNRDWRRGCR